MKKSKVVAVVGGKGGAGKTTTTVNFAAAAARYEKSILILDGERQGNASDHMGIDNTDQFFNAMDASMVDGSLTLRFENESIVVSTGTKGIDIIAGGARSAVVDAVHKASKIDLLSAAEIIRTRSAAYDIAVIDTPPDGYIQSVAIAAADTIVVPTPLSSFDVKGTEEVIALSLSLRAELGLPPAEYVILPVMVDMSQREAREQMAYLSEHETHKHMLAPLPVPHAVAVRVAQGYGQTIFEYRETNAYARKSGSAPANAYVDLARLIALDAPIMEATI